MKEKNNKKKIFNILLIMVIFLGGLFLTFDRSYITKVKADSGFDSSYDSGGWSDSSNWGSSSDWGSSSSWDDSDGSSSGFGIVELIIIVVIIIIIYNKVKASGGITTPISSKTILFNNDSCVSEEEIKKLIPNFNKTEFLKARYEDFVKIQNAWMKFDYGTLRSMLTDELYNQYEMQLDTLKIKNQKNVMSGLEYKDAKVTGINGENNQITITLEMIVSFYDYIEQNGNPVRGNKNVKITQHYEMTFVCSTTKNTDKCPNCGAKLEGDASNKCEYCGSIVTGLSDKWVMSKKESKRQK